jgi:ethanolamine utilization protein EutA
LHDDEGHHEDEDHDHLLEAPAGSSPLNLDWLELKSVGIDIGSSTTHLVFSLLQLERQGRELTSKYVVVKRQILYRSPIIHTSFDDRNRIDEEKLAKFIHDSYKEAGFDPSSIDTGAVICTGEAVRRENSEAITRLFSGEGGKFVCATAGPRFEGILASHGSGAIARSLNGTTVMNVDVGGGTSKVTIVNNGKVIETGAINVGARLIAWDSKQKLVRIEPAGSKIAESIGLQLESGTLVKDGVKRSMSKKLCELLFEYISRGSLSDLASQLLITEPLEYQGPINYVMFSGGVAEYIYGLESQEYGDLGPILGDEIKKRLASSFSIPLADSFERIRATVIGASQYTIQISSSTIFVSDRNMLPVRDSQVVVVNCSEDSNHISSEDIAAKIDAALKKTDLASVESSTTYIEDNRSIALFIEIPTEHHYNFLFQLAKGISLALARTRSPWILIFKQDIGGIVGHILKEELGVRQEILTIDEIEVADLDFIDIGQIFPSRNAVPVVIKSLIFS